MSLRPTLLDVVFVIVIIITCAMGGTLVALFW